MTFEPTTAVWTPGSSVRRVSAPAASTRQHVRLGRVLVRAEQHVVVADLEDLLHLQADRGHRHVVEREPARVLRIEGAHEAAVGQVAGDPDRDVEPSFVAVLADERRLPGVRIDAAGSATSSDPAIRRRTSAGRSRSTRPCTRYGNASTSHPMSTRPPSRSNTESVTIALSVPARRVADRARRRLGIDRPGDVPDADRTFVDASGGESVRRPGTTSSLAGAPSPRRRRTREPPGHVGVVVATRAPGRRRSSTSRTRSAPSSDVRDPPSGRIGPRIERRPGRGLQLAGTPSDQVGEEQPLAHRDRRHRQRAIGRVLGHPGQRLRSRSRRSRSSSEMRSSPSISGPKTNRSWARVDVEDPEVQPTGSSPDRDRRNATREPSSATMNVRGRPNV